MSHSSAGTSVVKYSEGERLLREAMPLRKAWAVHGGAGWVHGGAGWIRRGVVGWVHGLVASSAWRCSLQCTGLQPPAHGLQRGAGLGGELLLEHGEGVPQWLVHVLDELGAAPRPIRHHLQYLVHEVRAGVRGAEWLAHPAHGQDHPPHLVTG